MAEGAVADLPGRGEAQSQKLSLMRRAMVRRMTQAAIIPCFYLRVTADIAPAMRARERFIETGDGPRPTLNDYLLSAVARALVAHPEVNASYDDDGVTQHPRVNVGVAISVPDGLVVPAVYDADRKDLTEIAAATRSLAAAAASRRLGRDVLSDATFTLSNLGMYGIEDFDPVLNPPQAAILGVGAAAAPVERRRALRLTLGCDHRVLTGTEGATFLATVKNLLEATGE